MERRGGGGITGEWWVVGFTQKTNRPEAAAFATTVMASAATVANDVLQRRLRRRQITAGVNGHVAVVAVECDR